VSVTTVAQREAAKKSAGHKKPKAKAAAKKPPALKDAKLTAKGNPRTLAWVTAKGEDLPVGARVECPGGHKGTVRARCTKAATKDAPRVPYCGVELDKPEKFQKDNEMSRAVRRPTFPAESLVLLPAK